MILDTVNKSLEILLAGAVATNQLPWTAHFLDIDAATFAAVAAVSADGDTNGVTAVTVVAAPSAGQFRQVKELTVFNNDTASVTLTLRLNNNGTYRILTKRILAVNDSFEYKD